MIHEEKCLVVDVDGTLCNLKQPGQNYEDLAPNDAIVHKLRTYKQNGFHIIVYTSRNMRTYQGNIGLIVANTVKVLIDWLDKHEIPYDEICIGKPWPGRGGFYVDDKAIRPDEFLNWDYAQILQVIGNE